MIQETTTTMAPAQVLAAAKDFFTNRSGIYSAFLEQEGAEYATFRGQGGEELVIGATIVDGATVVRGSTYLFGQQVSRVFASLDPAPAAVAR